MWNGQRIHSVSFQPCVPLIRQSARTAHADGARWRPQGQRQAHPLLHGVLGQAVIRVRKVAVQVHLCSPEGRQASHAIFARFEPFKRPQSAHDRCAESSVRRVSGSYCRRGSGTEIGPGADVAGMSLVPVPVQIWAGVSPVPVPVQIWAGVSPTPVLTTARRVDESCIGWSAPFSFSRWIRSYPSGLSVGMMYTTTRCRSRRARLSGLAAALLANASTKAESSSRPVASSPCMLRTQLVSKRARGPGAPGAEADSALSNV